jgi:hypothetical protein
MCYDLDQLTVDVGDLSWIGLSSKCAVVGSGVRHWSGVGTDGCHLINILDSPAFLLEMELDPGETFPRLYSYRGFNHNQEVLTHSPYSSLLWMLYLVFLAKTLLSHLWSTKAHESWVRSQSPPPYRLSSLPYVSMIPWASSHEHFISSVSFTVKSNKVLALGDW